MGHSAVDRAPEVDLRRIKIDRHGVTAPVRRGRTAELSVDPFLQRRASQLLAAARPVDGAIVALDARTGKVLVWSERSRESRGDVLYRASYPAASLFKIVTTAALLEKTPLSPTTQICTRGGHSDIRREHLEPPPASGASCAPFSEALGHSKNAVYAQLTTRYLMRDDLVEVAERFGFNASLPFDVEVPMGRLSVPYNDLEFARTAAGFRDSTLSPLGAARLAHIVAAKGNALRLRIVESAGEYVAPERGETLRRVIHASTAARLRRMMEVTVHAGTSLEAFTEASGKSYLRAIRVAGKTGTLRASRGGPTTSWFIGFAPSRKPDIVISVLLNNGSRWRQKANELARDLLRAHFARRGVAGISDPLEASSLAANE